MQEFLCIFFAEKIAFGPGIQGFLSQKPVPFFPLFPAENRGPHSAVGLSFFHRKM
jgi:hypothetical protein